MQGRSYHRPAHRLRARDAILGYRRTFRATARLSERSAQRRIELDAVAVMAVARREHIVAL